MGRMTGVGTNTGVGGGGIGLGMTVGDAVVTGGVVGKGVEVAKTAVSGAVVGGAGGRSSAHDAATRAAAMKAATAVGLGIFRSPLHELWTGASVSQ